MPTFHTFGPVEGRTDGRTLGVTRRCAMCAQDITVYVKPDDWHRFVDGESFIQEIFPYLTPDQRELLLNGFCGPCFDKFCPPDDD